LRAAHEELGDWMERHSKDTWRWCERVVKVLDGCGPSMPDSVAIRAQWPYAGGQKPGCGFPTAKLVGLFCLGTGRLIRFALESWKTHEVPLARQLIAWMEPGEIVLTDRGFCGWGFIALLQRKGVDVVMRAHQARKIQGKRMSWDKPGRESGWTKALWDELPEQIAVRIVRFRVAVPGFRTQEIVLVTTLLDEKAYPDEAIAALYRRRWAVELCFRDIKTTLGLDVLRCQSPELVEKEVWLQVMAYNLVRALMLEAAWIARGRTRAAELQGHGRHAAAVDAALCPFDVRVQACARRIAASDRRGPGATTAESIGTACAKAPAKPYQMLTRPRHEMVVSPSRALK